MTICDQIRSRSTALAALGPGDPERDAALAHARCCPGCVRELHEGARLLELLDVELRREPPPSEAVLKRVHHAVLAEFEIEAQRAQPRWRSQVAFAGSSALAFALLVLL